MKHLSTKIMMSLLLLVVATVGLLWFYQVVLLEQHYLNRKVTTIQDDLRAIYKSDAVDSEEFLLESLEEAAYRNSLTIERVNLSGETFYSTDAPARGMTRSMGRTSQREQLIESALQRQPGQTVISHARFQTELIMLSMPVIRNEELMEVLLVSMPMESVEETVALLKDQLLMVSLLLTTLTVVIAVVLSGIVVKPIVLLKDATHKISQGKLDTRVPVKSRDEIGQLSGTFNEMAQQLGQIEELRRDFIANVSHELRTPLSLIHGYAETIRDLSGDQPEKRAKHAGIILDESRRLSSIVDDMLHLSQMQSGNLDLHKEPVDMSELILRVTDSFQVLAERSHITIETAFNGRIVALADSRRIEQVLVNLVGNAFHYSQSGGAIQVKAVEKEGLVTIQVKDHGSGIPAEELDHIWERYYRSRHHQSGRFHTGSGLGLAIVKNILEGHEAAYGVESRLGAGTAFWFSLKSLNPPPE